MKAILTLLFFLMASVAVGQTFQITIERDIEGKCINWHDITVIFIESAPGVKQIYTDIPDETVLDDDDTQEWYLPIADGTWNQISFSFSAYFTIPNKIKYQQYWFRYSQDGELFSDPQGCVIVKPGQPSKG